MRAITALVLLVLFTACRGSSEPSADRLLSSARTTGAGAQLVMLDSVRLMETDSNYIGRASGVAVDTSGAIFVADVLSARLLEFASDGRFMRAYGRKGSGPGELRKPVGIMLLGDSLVGVGNSGSNSPVVFDRRTGNWVATGRVGGYIFAGQQVGDSIWLAVLSKKRSTSLASWRIGADTMHYFGPVPREYTESDNLWTSNPFGPFVAWQDTVALGFATLNQILIMDGDGAVVDSVNPPVARRRGVPPNLVEEYAKHRRLEYYTQLASLLMQVGHTSDGRLILVHHDMNHDGDRFWSTAYVTLVSADRKSACLDARIDLSPDAQSYTAIVGDGVATYEQAAGSDNAESWVKTYRIDDSTCDWVPAR